MNGTAPPTASGLRQRRLTITAKLAVIVLIFVAIIAALAAVVALSLRLSSGARAYVGGEGLWSKAQKDAVYYLSRYAQTGEADDSLRYRQAIRIPLGDRHARLEMEKPDYDPAEVERGFVAGGNAAADVPDMIFLFRHFSGFGEFATAIRVWREAEQLILELDRIAGELHAGHMPPQRRQQLLQGIADINTRVAPLEHQFSVSIGDGARWVQHTLPALLLSITAVMLLAGLWVVWRISRDLQQGILGLREGALRVSRGDLAHRIEIASRDELGDLATVFNEMIVRRRLAEDALRDTTEFRDKVMESATNAIFAFDLQGRFTLLN
ncbi:MAG TPA: HAMP domain-containing protein, partial [Solimonas sp.]|nr:HAMP domain-containing protein [Solimonas sp.]